MRGCLVLILASCLVLLTCSRDVTNPNEDDNAPQTRKPFSIVYTVDPSRAVSARIVAATGGSITAWDKDSVSFALTIPARALSSDTNITITPFSFLRIGGPGGDSCSACTGADSLCCYRGALFEPSGLVLDSSAVLTVQLPKGMAFPFPHGGLIVYLDSASESYQPCFTANDATAGRLQAEITHFSGYGTDDERYDRLEEEIYQAGERLSADAGTWAFYVDLSPLKELRLICNSCADPDLPLNACYPDLVAAIEKIVLDAYARHAALIRGKAVLQEPCDALGNLYMCFGVVKTLFELGGNWGNSEDFIPIRNGVRDDYVALVYKTGNEGHRLCQADSCDAGMALLSCAHEAIRLSTYSEIDFDAEFCASVNNWMISCKCGMDVSLFADKDVVHKIALTSADAENCIVRYSVGVHNNSTEEPVEGADVQLIELTPPIGSHSIGYGRTDSDGHCEIIYKGSDFGASCMLEKSNRVFAEATIASKNYYSDTVSVVFKPLRIATTINFQYHHEVEGLEGYMEEATASITGTVTGPACGMMDPRYWEGGFLRSWSCAYEYPYDQTSLVGRLISEPLIVAPIAEFFADSFVIVPGTSIQVKALSAVYIHMGSVREYVAVEFSGISRGIAYCDTISETVFGCGNHYYCTPVRDIYPPFLPVNGSFEPYFWSRDTLGNTATQTVIVEPVF
jgi:hypothetical protein